jgi:hypothetical protein
MANTPINETTKNPAAPKSVPGNVNQKQSFNKDEDLEADADLDMDADLEADNEQDLEADADLDIEEDEEDTANFSSDSVTKSATKSEDWKKGKKDDSCGC